MGDMKLELQWRKGGRGGTLQ